MMIQEVSGDFTVGGIMFQVPRQVIRRQKPKTTENRRNWVWE